MTMGKKKEPHDPPSEATVEATAQGDGSGGQPPQAEPVAEPHATAPIPTLSGLWAEVAGLLDQGEPVQLRCEIATGSLVSIDGAGTVQVRGLDGELMPLPGVLGDQAAYELVQDQKGAYTLRDLGRGREPMGSCSETIRHYFTKPEMEDLAKEMDAAHEEADKEGYRLAGLQARVKESKGLIEGHLQRAAEASQRRRQGWDMREYPCTVYKDYFKGVKEIVRDDNGAVLKEIPLAEPERQAALPLAEPEAVQAPAEEASAVVGNQEVEAGGETCCATCGTVTTLDGDGFAPEGWRKTPGSNPAVWTCPDCLATPATPPEPSAEGQDQEPAEVEGSLPAEGEAHLPDCINLEARSLNCGACGELGCTACCCAGCLMQAEVVDHRGDCEQGEAAA